MGRDIDLTDGGVAIFREAVANGVAAVTVDAPADLTGAGGSYAMELLDALPAGSEFIQIDAAGKWTTAPASALGTLDAAYDSGGPGAGRQITADSGAVEITTPAASGNNVLRLTQADNQVALFINKSGLGGGQAILIADAGTGVMIQATKTGSGLAMLVSNLVGSISVGNGTDIQGDSATGALSVLSNDVGTNPVIKTFQFGAGVALHVDNSGNAFEAIIRLESGSGVTDAKVEFVQNAIRRWELGYDESAGGFLLGRLSFANPAIFVEDFAGHVHLGAATAPASNARLQVTEAGSTVAIFTSATGLSRLALEASGTSSPLHVGVHAQADTLILYAGNTNSVIVSADGRVDATNWGIAADGDASFGNVADTSDHDISIIANSGGAPNLSTLNFGALAAAQGAIRYRQGATSIMQVVVDGTIGFRLQGGGVSGLFIGNPSGASSGNNILVIENGAAAPGTTPTNSTVLFSEDVAASSELKVRDEAGNVTTLSPHSEVDGHELSEDMAWSFYSKRDGKYVWVDMLRVVRLLERLTGEELAFMGKAA